MKDILRAGVYGGLFLIPFLTLLVTESLFFPYITGKNFAFRIIVELVMALWVVLALLDAQYRPRFSYILASFATLIVVMLASTLMAHNVHTAFWSNFERMDGYIGLLHVFGYFLVLGSMLTQKKHWLWFLWVSVGVATVVALQGLAQLASSENTGIRVDSTLGNAAYMAVYMLFQLFFIAYLFFQTKNPLVRVVYAILSVLFLFILVQTGTRGTVLGLATGAITVVGYISLFGTKVPTLRRYAVGAVLGLIILGAGFVGFKDTQFIQDNPNLARIANIDLKEDLAIRSIIWRMALEGVKERPVLGWGMGNFNYVFNEQYDPRLYGQEQWFDRVHNIALDWLVAGGVVGFLAYLLLFASLFYYLIVRPYFYNDETFTIIESAVLVGLIVGYITHNLVVFDNIVSYIFFATIIAYIHYRVAKPVDCIQKYQISPLIVKQIVAPIVLVIFVVVFYFANVPAISAGRDIITALKTADLNERYTYFDSALSRDSFAEQEIVEQFVQQTIKISTNPEADVKLRNLYLTRAEEEINKQITKNPGNARLHVFAASFYRSTGQLEKAVTELALARELSPNKQWIILQQGAAALSEEKNEEARDYFETAFLLDEHFVDAREYYVSSLFLTGATTTARELIAQADDAFYDRISQNNYLLSVVNQSGDKQTAIELFERRVELDASVAQTWASLAFLYYENKNNDKAIETLRRGAVAVPAFKKTADCIESNISAGKAPETPCS